MATASIKSNMLAIWYLVHAIFTLGGGKEAALPYFWVVSIALKPLRPPIGDFSSSLLK